jgi:hypothetical protein
MVGARGFEPPASWSRTRRATRLRYAPTRHDFCQLTALAKSFSIISRSQGFSTLSLS